MKSRCRTVRVMRVTIYCILNLSVFIFLIQDVRYVVRSANDHLSYASSFEPTL